MAQKELEKEKGEFDDKERFVTSAYKKKLEERKKLEEELAREAALEGMWYIRTCVCMGGTIEAICSPVVV